MCRKHAWLGLCLLIGAGCTNTPVRSDVDALLCSSALRPLDLLPPGDANSAKTAAASRSGTRPDAQFDQLVLTAAQDQKAGDDLPKGQPTLVDRLKVPADLAGSEAKPIVMPDAKNVKEYQEAVKKVFPDMPDIGPEPLPATGPDGGAITLADLQHLAHSNNPVLRQAASDVEAARGTMIQAGLYANPTVGLTGSTATQSGGPTFGPIFSQNISTMGKLKLARAAAEKDLENAQLAYRRAETDLMANVRTGYFSVLVAEESVRQNRALVVLTDEFYKVLLQNAKGGESATYEPMQVRVFAAQARAGLIQARNSYTLAWKQLTSTLGLPAMPPTQLAGKIRELPLPRYRYDTALAHILSNHTDVVTAINGIEKARFNLRLAEVTPVPDITAQLGIFNDQSQPGPYRVGSNFQVSVPVPVFNLNQGAIRQARAALLRANEEPHRVRDDLTARTADAYRRYSENFELLELYHKEILPKQVQAYRSAVQRYSGGEVGAVAFLDLVTAEQNMVSAIGTYLTTLQSQWQAVADLGSLLQTDDIFQLAEGKHFAELPDLSHLSELPCCHPCNPLPNDAFKGADLHWPEAGFVPSSTGTLGGPVPMDAQPAVAPQLGRRS